MKNSYILLFVFSITLMKTFSQPVAPLNYNNFWVYGDNLDQSDRWKYVVDNKLFTIDSSLYFKVTKETPTYQVKYLRLRDDNFYVQRVDSSLNQPNNELIYYKQNAQKGDSWEIQEETGQTVRFSVEDTTTIVIWGIPVIIKYLIIESDFISSDEYWTEEFGLIFKEVEGGGNISLKGCLIDSVVYGDTSLVTSVNDEIEKLTTTFELYQNYPNPFNPSTNIEYTVPDGDYITLEVFNILGEKIITLVNGYQQPGKYSIKFNAENLASGTYLYVLKTTDLIETKKMLVTK